MELNWSRTVTAVVAWIAGAATATTAGVLALSAIDFGRGVQPAGQPLPHPLLTASGDPSQPDPSASPTNASSGLERLISTAGGGIVARCLPDGRAYLVSWSPAPNFHSEDVRRGPATTARLIFEGRDEKYAISVQCVNGVPRESVVLKR